jgi:choline dehydrogenase-like flavoprotein
LVVDFRYLDLDIDSVVRSHEKLDAGLRRTGLGHLEYHCVDDGCHDLVQAQCSDGYHQIGTTRMSADPQQGVVDPHCRVHGFDNLYVASASTFPSAGSANPTLHITAMALRLADHIQRQARQDGVATPVRDAQPLAEPIRQPV